MSPKPTYEALEQKIEELELTTIQNIELNEELRKSDELFEKTFISQRDAIFILDSEIPPKIIDCNPAAEKAFGYTRQEMLERPTVFLHINEPTLIKFQENLYPSVEDRGYYYLSEFEMKKKDGTMFVTEHTVFPLQNERGIRIGWVSVISDINERKLAQDALQKAHDELERRVEKRTVELVRSNEMLKQEVDERKQTEEALRESEKRYRAVVDSQAEMICRFFPDGTLTFVNEAYCRYFDKGHEELIGHKFMPLIPENEQDKVFEKISSLNPNTPVTTHEHRVFAPNGEVCWHKWTNRAIFDDKNNLMEYQAVGWDITNRVRVEESLQKAHDELERRVEERTRKLEVQKNSLEEINIAMKVLLKKREEDKIELQGNILSNVKTLVEPYVNKLKGYSLPQGQKTLINILESNLNEIVSPFARKLSSKLLNLTPSEIQVANLVKQGETTKEMAGILNISGKTVGFHRENIRKKLGIKNKKANLRAHLLSL